MMRAFHCLLLCVLFTATAGMYLYGQPQSQETVNALQDQRLTQIEVVAKTTAATLDTLSREMAGLRSSLDRFTGIGLGLGAALTAIQGLLVIITIRNGKKG